MKQVLIQNTFFTAAKEDGFLLIDCGISKDKLIFHIKINNTRFI